MEPDLPRLDSTLELATTSVEDEAHLKKLTSKLGKSQVNRKP